MKNKTHIEAALTEEYAHLEGDIPMDEMEWAHNKGWIEALEFVLDIDKDIREQKARQERLNKILLTDKERKDIIGRTIQRAQHENQSLIDDEDSESCGVCTCGIHCA